MLHREKPKNKDDNHGRDRERDGKLTRVLRPKKVQAADHNNSYAREKFWMRHAEELKRRQCTDRRGHGGAWNEQKGPDDRDCARTVMNASIYPTAIWIVSADGHVVDPN